MTTIQANGYFFLIEVKYKMIKKGGKYAEIPFVFVDRVNGDSKMSFKIIWENIKGVIKLKLN
jgi:dolichol-phosphate mannosyltransferase